MAEPPARIVSEHAQPITGGEEELRPLYRTGYIIFESQSLPPKFVEVLANEAAAIPSLGYAKWAHIPRPQRKALTILEGYEPMTLTVPILFDAVRNNGVREDVENQIQWLEWMAGRGIKHVEGYTAGLGEPPRIVVYSTKSAEGGTPLIPAPFQSKNLKWFIDDLTFDEHPLRSPGGARTRQAVTVRLVEYVQDPLIRGGPSKEGFTVKKITGALYNIQKLVAHWLAGTRTQNRLAEAVSATISENKFNRKIGTNPHKKLKNGTGIRIPNRFLKP